MLNVLVICTHNSARSILAEVLLNHHGAGVLKAYSAGSAPRANQQPNALGLHVLREHGHGVDALRSKSWDAFVTKNSPPIDLLITVCDSAAGETCPLFLGSALKVHWGYADPSAGSGTGADKLAAFRATYAALARRIERFIGLLRSAQVLDAQALQSAAFAVKDLA
jgi:arsenate reductase (thioredoxin)